MKCAGCFVVGHAPSKQRSIRSASRLLCRQCLVWIIALGSQRGSSRLVWRAMLPPRSSGMDTRVPAFQARSNVDQRSGRRRHSDAKFWPLLTAGSYQLAAYEKREISAQESRLDAGENGGR